MSLSFPIWVATTKYEAALLICRVIEDDWQQAEAIHVEKFTIFMNKMFGSWNNPVEYKYNYDITGKWREAQ